MDLLGLDSCWGSRELPQRLISGRFGCNSPRYEQAIVAVVLDSPCGLTMLSFPQPVTWIPLVWGVMCGAAASGNYHWIWNPFDPNDRDVMLGLTDTAKGFVAMILAGPFLTGYTQTINDWYDREIDAINEPYRPIPSGAISEGQVMFQIWFLLLGGLGIAYGLDVWAGHEIPSVLLLSIFGSFISYIYSAPPLKLKQNGWAGNFALGASYISLPWWCGQAVFGTLDRPVYWIL